VEYQNNPSDSCLVRPYSVIEKGVLREGFAFNEKAQPELRLAELYALHIRNARLDIEDKDKTLIKDLYKFYYRAGVALLSKYFDRSGKYGYLYQDIPLFVPGESLEEADARIRAMKTKERNRSAATKGTTYSSGRSPIPNTVKNIVQMDLDRPRSLSH
jgi:hypothetical protein